MNGKLLLYSFFILIVSYSLVVAQNDKRREWGRMAPDQLMKHWETANPREHGSIQDTLWENIPAALPVLRQTILTGTLNQKLFACALMARMRDRNSSDILLKALEDADGKLKTRIILSLREIGDSTAANRIRRELLSTKNNSILKASLSAIGKLGTARDMPILKKYLPHPDESVRVNAAAALALLGSYQGQEILLTASRSTNPLVAKEATYSLGLVDTTKSKSRLREILNDPNGAWKSYAQIALLNQRLTRTKPEDKINVLKASLSDKNERLAEWALERMADLEDPQIIEIFEKTAQTKNKLGRKASRLLKIVEARS